MSQPVGVRGRMGVLERDGFRISDDSIAVDLTTVHAFLTETYWSRGISREL